MKFEKTRVPSPKELNAARTELGMSLKKFWGAVGCSPSRGCAYEKGSTALPDKIHTLLYMHYQLGIPTDITSDEFADFERSMLEANPVHAVKAQKMLAHGMQSIQKALKELKK